MREVVEQARKAACVALEKVINAEIELFLGRPEEEGWRRFVAGASGSANQVQQQRHPRSSSLRRSHRKGPDPVEPRWPVDADALAGEPQRGSGSASRHRRCRARCRRSFLRLSVFWSGHSATGSGSGFTRPATCCPVSRAATRPTSRSTGTQSSTPRAGPPPRLLSRPSKPTWMNTAGDAVAYMEKDLASLAHYDFPPEHWDALRTTNPIERVNKEFKRRSKAMEVVGADRLKVILAFTALKLEFGWAQTPITSGKLRKLRCASFARPSWRTSRSRC